jgi:hypothetical protein
MDEKRLLPDPIVCRCYGVSAMTIWRWEHDPQLDFPKAILDVKWCHPKLVVEVRHLAGSKTLHHATVRSLSQ